MTRILTAATLLLLLGAGTAFGAESGLLFYNKLGALLLLNAVIGGFLAFFAAVIASRIWLKAKTAMSRLSPSRLRSASVGSTRRTEGERQNTVSLGAKVVNS